MSIRIDALPDELSPSENHEIPAMLNGSTVHLTAAQLLGLLVGTAPDVLDTFQEVYAALNDDENFGATIVAALADKLAKSGGVMTGAIQDLQIAPSAAPTKVLDFDLTAITAGQTRTVSVPDRDVSIGTGLVFIESFDLSTNPTVEITDMLTDGFDQYRLDVIGAVPATAAADIHLQNSTNNGSTYGATADVNWNRRQQTTASATVTGLFAGADTKAILANNVANTASLAGAGGYIEITPVSGARCRATHHLQAHTGANEYDSFGSSFFAVSSNAFKLLPSTGGWSSGRVNVSGYRRS